MQALPLDFRKLRVGYWLGAALLLLVAAVLAGLIHPLGGHRVYVPPSVWQLPLDAAWSLERMVSAYILSLAFSISVGMYIARNEKARKIILPILDILQSIPIVTFFPAALAVAVRLFGGGRLGFEIGAIILIFTSMAWNMAFSVYESVRMIPRDMLEAAESFGIRGLQKFVTLLLPACVPGLLYNSIVSWAAGWFALSACEILQVGNQSVPLPGLGSFLAEAAQSKHHAIELNLLGVAVLLGVILLLDFFLWRPLAHWAERFRNELTVSTMTRGGTGVAGWYQHGAIPRLIVRSVLLPLNKGVNWAVARVHGSAKRLVLPRVAPPAPLLRAYEFLQRMIGWLVLAAIVICGGYYCFAVVHHHLPALAWEIPAAIGSSFLRILLAYVLSLCWIIPVLLWARTRPRAMRLLSSLAQTLAGMPPIALTFLVVGLFVHHLQFGPRWGVELAGLVLLMNGVQWYVLFNMIGGISRIPGDLVEACGAMGLSRWMRFRRLLLPAILPSLFTGTLTAFGGGWNTLIFSESIAYQGHYYSVLGIGWLLDVASSGSNPPIASGVPLPAGQAKALLLAGVACLIVVIVILNRLVWKRLQAWAADRFRIEY
ncbi:MAG: ABC transporter permease subunit [Phycisphaerales bacterium]|nr:ABC transporter permease subunit [Phycisphaerales bacterium]